MGGAWAAGGERQTGVRGRKGAGKGRETPSASQAGGGWGAGGRRRGRGCEAAGTHGGNSGICVRGGRVSGRENSPDSVSLTLSVCAGVRVGCVCVSTYLFLCIQLTSQDSTPPSQIPALQFPVSLPRPPYSYSASSQSLSHIPLRSPAISPGSSAYPIASPLPPSTSSVSAPSP